MFLLYISVECEIVCGKMVVCIIVVVVIDVGIIFCGYVFVMRNEFGND